MTVDADSELPESIVAHAVDGLGVFAEFPGFLGGTTHLSLDRSRLVQSVRWRTEADYTACMEDPRWDTVPSAIEFQEAVRDRTVRVDVRAFTVERVY